MLVPFTWTVPPPPPVKVSETVCDPSCKGAVWRTTTGCVWFANGL